MYLFGTIRSFLLDVEPREIKGYSIFLTGLK